MHILQTWPLRTAKVTTNFFLQGSPLDSKGSVLFEVRLHSLTSLDAISDPLVSFRTTPAQSICSSSIACTLIWAASAVAAYALLGPSDNDKCACASVARR